MLMPFKRGDVGCPKCGFQFEFHGFYWKTLFGEGYLHGRCPNCHYEYRMRTKDAGRRTEIGQGSTKQGTGV
jgi:ssDNA-binding Zn-finger/Zn-ribbon topoisomerase 1